MRTKKEIKQTIENLKQDILQNVMAGCFSNEVLYRRKCWIEALEYVIDEDCKNE